MRYMVIFHTREHTDVSIPSVAKSLLESLDMLISWQNDGTIIQASLVGHLTPLLTHALFEAESHEAVYQKILQLPAIPYLHTEIIPVLSLESLRPWLEKLAASS